MIRCSQGIKDYDVVTELLVAQKENSSFRKRVEEALSYIEILKRGG